jgi:hypothetical protein
MPANKEYTAEFKEQAVRFVLKEIEPDESRKHACDRLAPPATSPSPPVGISTVAAEPATARSVTAATRVASSHAASPRVPCTVQAQ